MNYLKNTTYHTGCHQQNMQEVRDTGTHSKGRDSSTKKAHTMYICPTSVSCTAIPGLTLNNHGIGAVIPSLFPVLLTVMLSVAISGSFLALLHGRTIWIMLRTASSDQHPY